MDLSAFIERCAQRFPGKAAIHFEGEDLSYRAFYGEILEREKSLDVGRGDRVAYLGFNDPKMLVLLFALARRGAILVPLNWRLTAAEHKQILADCTPHRLIVGEEFAARKADLQWVDGKTNPQAPGGQEEDDALIVYTSGTTGKPKGAVLTQAALVNNALNSFYAHDLQPEDHVLTALPMFHVGGLNIQTLPALFMGCTVSLHKRFEPGRWLADVQARRPTLSLLVPATMAAVIAHPDWAKTDLSSLRLLNAGSMVIPDSLIRAFHDRGIPVGQVYGATETAPIAIALKKEDALRKPGSAGKPVPHAEAKLVEGEIWIRGPAVMRGYWNDPTGLDAEGWFHSGDLGRVDEDGFWWVVGRSKDVIISGGENVHPAELENVLADCPAIAEAVVVGVPDPRWGEVACAVVVRNKDSALKEEEVLHLFDDRLARYKHPKRVVFLDELPKNAMGKVQRPRLRQLVSPAG
ncbi:MAG: class I adenylate-forming enzyme family protein [Clostridia bacterium]